MSEIFIEYKPHDFVYYSDNVKQPNCSKYDLNSSKCSNNTNCYNLELCKNKKYADQLIEMSKMHSGSSERYLNTINIYNKEVFTTANLVFGIVLCSVFIYYNKDYNKILKCVKI